MSNSIQFLNPEGLMHSSAFSQVVTTQGNGKTIYIGGQNAVNAKGEIIGKGSLKEQTVQVMKNIQTALQACGAGMENVVKLSIFMVQGQDVREGFEASQPFFADLKHLPAITGMFVAGLTNPDYLVEIEAVAFIGE